VVQPPAGFGFLTRGEGTPNIFVHMESLRVRHHGAAPGQIVLSSLGPAQGMMAAEVRPDGVPSGRPRTEAFGRLLLIGDEFKGPRKRPFRFRAMF